MNRAPPKLATVLLSIAGLGLLAQAALWSSRVGWRGAGAIAGVAVLVALCAAFGYRMLRRAFRPLAIESWRLQELAIGWEVERALSSPSLVGSDHTLRDVEALRRQLFERLAVSHGLRKRAEEASAYKTGFLKSVQHELRTPLNAILGFAEVLLSGIEGPLTAGQRENLVVIQRTGKRLQDLFDEVIELAAAASGELELQKESIDVGRLLEQVGEALEEERGDRPVHIRIDLPEGLPHVSGDLERVRRFVKGLGSQALGVSGPLLVLGAAQAGPSVRLFVRDPGRRLEPEELQALLGAAPSTVRRKGLDEGTRLRLALFRQLADLLGARFELTSGEGGTVLALELPVEAAA